MILELFELQIHVKVIIYEFNCIEDLRQAQTNLGVFPGAAGNMYIANFFYPFLSCRKFTELEVITLLKTA